MTPTVGRIVHFVLPGGRSAGEVRPAIITRVNNETNVNLRVYLDGPNDEGASDYESSAILTNEEKRDPRGWFWPPRAAA